MNPPPDQLIDDLELLEPPYEFHFPWGLLAVAALFLFFFWLIRYWRKKTAPQRWLENLPEQAAEDALAALESLAPLIEREDGLAYADESSAIIRRYLETKYQFHAPRLTTEEFLQQASRVPLLRPAHQRLLRGYLQGCDLLKFGKARANVDELRELHAAALGFVRDTRDSYLAPPA